MSHYIKSKDFKFLRKRLDLTHELRLLVVKRIHLEVQLLQIVGSSTVYPQVPSISSQSLIDIEQTGQLIRTFAHLSLVGAQPLPDFPRVGFFLDHAHRRTLEVIVVLEFLDFLFLLNSIPPVFGLELLLLFDLVDEFARISFNFLQDIGLIVLCLDLDGLVDHLR